MQEESSNGESSFEFVDKKSESAIANNHDENEGAGDGSKLLSKVAPPSALPSFVPVPQTAAPSSSNKFNSFHPTTFSPVIPANKGSGTTSTVNSDHTVDQNVGSNKGEGTTSPITATEPQNESNTADQQNQSGLLSWVKDTDKFGWVMKVASKAKTSVDTMITTLDPQMKDFLSPTAEIEVIVASDKEVKISPIREAFQSVFSRCTVRGLGAAAKQVAAQPVGYEAANKAAWERIEAVRSLQPSGPIIAIENFVVQVMPDKWFDLGVLVLSDIERGLALDTYTQMTPVPNYIVTLAEDDTPGDYPLRSTGYAITIGSLMASNLHVHHSEWHHALTGVSRRDMLLLAAKSLANIYKNSIQ